MFSKAHAAIQNRDKYNKKNLLYSRMDFQIPESHYCHMHRVTWTWQCCCFLLLHPEKYWQRVPSDEPYLWRVLSCSEGTVALWIQRGFSLSLFLLTLLSIRDRKGQVKFSLCLDNYLLPCWEPMCLNWFPSFLCQKRNYFLSWLILPWARAQKKTLNQVSLSGIVLTELLSAPESAFLKPESPPPHLCWLGDG